MTHTAAVKILTVGAAAVLLLLGAHQVSASTARRSNCQAVPAAEVGSITHSHPAPDRLLMAVNEGQWIVTALSQLVQDTRI